MVGLTGQSQGAAHGPHSTELARRSRNAAMARRWRMVRVKLQVPGDEQIQEAIMVIVSPCRPRGPAPESDACLLCEIAETTVVIIVIQAVFPKVSDVKVSPAIIVVVANRDSESPAFVGHSGFLCYVRKGAVVIVTKEHRARRGLFSILCRHRGAIQHVNVEPPIIVIIEQCHARAYTLQNHCFFGTARPVQEIVQTRGWSHVFEYHRSAIHKATSGNRSHFAIFDRRTWWSGRYPHGLSLRWLMKIRVLRGDLHHACGEKGGEH